MPEPKAKSSGAPKKKPEQAWREHKKERFLTAYRKLGGMVTAAEAVDVSPNTIWEWRQDDEEFASRFNALREKDTEQLEKEARRRALKKSDLLMMFLLKGRRPETYRDNSKVEHTGTVSIKDLLLDDGKSPEKPTK